MNAGILDITADAYHADPADTPSLSASVAHLLCTSSPKHAWTAHPKLNPDFVPLEAEKFDVGRAAHALLLEGGSGVEVIDAPDWRTQLAKDARDQARDDGKAPLLSHQYKAAQEMMAAAVAQLKAINADPPIFGAPGKPEQTLVWEDQGVLCRARCDWLRDDRAAIDDYKTTAKSANPEGWSSLLFRNGCDVQAAFYTRGVRALTGVEPEFRFVVQETYPPFALSVVSLGPDAQVIARKKVEYALELWRGCLRDDRWPAYPTEVCYATLPAWEEARWLARETREELAA